MLNIIQITLDSETKLFVETVNIKNDDGGAFEHVSNRSRIIEKTKSFIDESMGQISAFASSISSSIKNSNASPDEVEVEFAVKFSADAGVIITSVGSEANISIKMKWNKSKDSTT